jgi:predicted 3-demethylubiquinone-9 3-methyltransferase (glyoxalase superfamily)
MSKIHPFLWFDTEAEDAMNFYCSLFKDARKGKVTRFPDAVPGMGGKVVTAEFELFGQPFTALNGNQGRPFTEAVSFYVDCEDQAEVDRYWTALIADGGEESMCGWLKDRYGVSWQIIPKALPRLMGDKDREKANRVVEAMLKMRKIVVADLEKAHAG